MFCLWIFFCSVHVARSFEKGKSAQVLDTTPDFTCGFDIWDQNNRAVAEKNGVGVFGDGNRGFLLQWVG